MFALWISLIFLFLQLRYTDTLFTEQEVRYSLQWKCILGNLCVNWIKRSVQIYCNIYYFSFQRGLSIKSVPVSLVLPDTKGKSFLVNVFDTPGKIMDSSIAIYCKTEYRIICYYYMPCVCRQYNVRSDWLIVIELQALFSHNAHGLIIGLQKQSKKKLKKPFNFCLKIVLAENEWWGGTHWEWILFLPYLLPTGQMRIKSCFPRGKIPLSQMTRWHFLRAQLIA